MASGTKALTALTVVSLVQDGVLGLDTRARSLLGADLPLIDDAVTVEMLLAHRSGIGDYVDEDDGAGINDYVLPVPVHELATTEQYLSVLDGHPAKFSPGSSFSYCNSGYVVLALLAERATGTPFPQLVQERVCRPAGMSRTAFLRSDELPAGVATGYLGAGLRTNVFHLPVRGSGDGGAYTTVADIRALWQAFAAGRIVSPDRVAEMQRPHSAELDEGRLYGLGLWLPQPSSTIVLEGMDAGVSFRSVYDPASGRTHTVIANTSHGAWPITGRLDRLQVLR